jgi:DNA-binding HxlR family transcriptional regulator
LQSATRSATVVGVDPQTECSIAATLAVIGDRWTILILRDSFRGIRRFDDFQQSLGIARNLLTDRLCRLVEHEVLEKVPYQDHPVRYEYRLTAKGVDLSPPLVALMHWGDRWETGDSGPPVVLVHDSCGTAVAQELLCWHCDTTVTPAELRNKNAPRSLPENSEETKSYAR